MIDWKTRALLVGAVLTLARPAGSQGAPTPDTAPLPVRSLAASCGACHGTDGHAVDGQSMVALAGLPREVLAAQLRAFRDGTRDATVMHQIARGYNDAQIDTLAAYFASRPARRP